MPSISSPECHEPSLVVHGDFRIVRPHTRNSAWKMGYVHLAWKEKLNVWFLRIYPSVNKGVPEFLNSLKQNKVKQISKAQGATHGAFINLILNGGTHVNLRRNAESTMNDFEQLAQILQEIKAGKYEKSICSALDPSEKENMGASNNVSLGPAILDYIQSKPLQTQVPSSSPEFSNGSNKVSSLHPPLNGSSGVNETTDQTGVPRTTPEPVPGIMGETRKTEGTAAVVQNNPEMKVSFLRHVTKAKPQTNPSLTSSPSLSRIHTPSKSVSKSVPKSVLPACSNSGIVSAPVNSSKMPSVSSQSMDKIACVQRCPVPSCGPSRDQNIHHDVSHESPVKGTNFQKDTVHTYSRFEKISSSSFYSPLLKRKGDRSNHMSPAGKTPDEKTTQSGVVEKFTSQRSKPGRRLFVIDDDQDNSIHDAVPGKMQKSNPQPIVDAPQCDLSILGFPNIGNSCYINSVLQAVLNIGPFTSSLLDACEKHSGRLPEKSLVSCMGALLKAQASSPGMPDYKGLLSELKNSITAVDPTFIGNHQHDAHEFLGRVLEQVSEEVTQLKKDDECQSIGNPVSENFEFEMINSFACNGCGEVSSHKEPNLMLSADIPHQKNGCCVTLQDVLNSYFESVTISKTCEKCSSKEAKCLKMFEKCPRFLIIHLKRYQYANNEAYKKCQDVFIPPTIRLDPFVPDDTIFSCSSSSLVVDASVLSKRISMPVVKNLQNCRKRKADGQSQSEMKRISSEILTPVSNNCKENKENLNPVLAKVSTDLTSDAAKTDIDNQNEVVHDDDIDFQTALLNSIMDTPPSFESGVSYAELAESLVEEAMEFDKENAEPSASSPFSYQLLGIVSHLGESVQHGHYVCDLLCSDQEWLHFNDDLVYRISLKDVLRDRRKSGYLFFYVSRDTLPSCK